MDLSLVLEGVMATCQNLIAFGPCRFQLPAVVAEDRGIYTKQRSLTQAGELFPERA